MLKTKTTSSTDIYGVPTGVFQCQLNREQELSNRIAARNIPSAPLEPSYSCRAVPTKYTLMPIIDERKAASVPLLEYPPYNISDTFNPGTTESPWSGFAKNINDESKLRNQFFAIQNCPQSYYIPSSNSDLYKPTVIENKESTINQSLLFANEPFKKFNPNQYNLGYLLLNNPTRTQLIDTCDIHKE